LLGSVESWRPRDRNQGGDDGTDESEGFGGGRLATSAGPSRQTVRRRPRAREAVWVSSPHWGLDDLSPVVIGNPVRLPLEPSARAASSPRRPRRRPCIDSPSVHSRASGFPMIDFATSNRRRPRSAASALVLAGKRWGGAYVVENLSSSGALLRGEGELAVGEGVRVLLRLCPETTVSLTAQVTTADKHALAVAFRDVPATTRQSLEQYIRESLEAAKGASTPRILVVDDCLEICRALSRDLRSFGRDVVSAGTLQEAKAQVEAIEAHSTPPSSTSPSGPSTGSSSSMSSRRAIRTPVACSCRDT